MSTCICFRAHGLMEEGAVTVTELWQKQLGVEQQTEHIKDALNQTALNYHTSQYWFIVEFLLIVLVVATLLLWSVDNSYAWWLWVKTLPFTKPT